MNRVYVSDVLLRKGLRPLIDAVTKRGAGRFKKKWAKQSKKKTPFQHTLEHLDHNYPNVLGDQWPSARIAMLSQQKYCVVLNNFTENTSVKCNLIAEGAYPFTSDVLRDEFMDEFEKKWKNIVPPLNAIMHDSNEFECDRNNNLNSSHEIDKSQVENTDSEDTDLETDSEYESDSDEESDTEDSDNPRTDMYDFMPVKQLYTRDNFGFDVTKPYNASDTSLDLETNFPIPMVPTTSLSVPEDWNIFLYERGNVTMFPETTIDEVTGLNNCFFMDGSSILPVLALDLNENCEVLDMCAAPGGKTFLILQSGLLKHLTCVENSKSRMFKLKNLLRYFFPHFFRKAFVDIVLEDARDWCNYNGSLMFDRVLVDAPCTTDRKMLFIEENNIFKPSRKGERLALPKLQQELLWSGIKKCRPGGVVVYSTCTLAPGQNDAVVHAALEQMLNDTDIEVEIESLDLMVEQFRHIYNFQKCRFGQLVVPNLTANFGPMYICKIRRLS